MQKFEPSFDFDNSESSTLLHQSQAEVCINQNTYTGNAEVRLELLPRADIYVYGYFRGVPAIDAMKVHIGQNEISSFSLNSRQIEGFRLGTGGNAETQEFNLKWCPKSEPINGIGDESTQMAFLVFHLFNFVDLVGTRRSTTQSGSTMHAIEHVDLIFNQWNIELKSLLTTSNDIKKLKKEGGYCLTHIGGIKKNDDTLFSGKDGQDCLTALRFFLSFAKGGWCEPICAVGFNASGSRVWESWLSPREPWHAP